MTAALEGGEWSAARPGPTLPSGKTRYPFYTRLGGSQGRSGRAENRVPTGIRSRTVAIPIGLLIHLSYQLKPLYLGEYFTVVVFEGFRFQNMGYTNSNRGWERLTYPLRI